MQPDKTSKFSAILLMLLLTVNAFNIAKAEYIMTITGGEVPAQESITIEILIDNTGNFAAFQVDIPIPEQFSYVAGSAALNPERRTDHLLHAEIVEGNILRFISFSLSNASFLGNTGSVASFEMIAGTQPGDYPLTPVNPIIGIAEGGNVITDAIAGVATILAPDIHVSPQSLNFGEIPLTAHQDMTLTLQNTGNQPLDVSGVTFDSPFFEVLNDAVFTLSPGSTQQLIIRFNSLEKGHYNQQMTISSNDPDEQEVVVNLEAVAFAVNELHCGSMLSFSGEQDTLTLSINNMEEYVAFQFDLLLPDPLNYVPGSAFLSGRKTDHIVDADIIGENTLRVAAFSISNEPFTGDNGAIVSLVFDVFGTGGWYPLSLSNVIISNDTPENIVSAYYNGSLQVAAPDIHAAGSISFGDVSVLETGEETLRIHNYGSDLLVINNLQTSNDSFYIQQALPVEIPVGQYVDLEVFFHHPEKDIHEAQLLIFSNDPDENPFVVALSANAFAPNYMIVQNTEASQESIVQIDILVENLEDFVAFDFHLNYPDNVMTFLPGEEFTWLTDRAEGHELFAGIIEPGVLRAFAFSLGQEAFSGHSGAVVKLGFEVHSSQESVTFPLVLENVILSDASGQNILYAAADGIITIVEGPPGEQFLSGMTITTGEETCFDATQTITTGGNGHFIIESGAQLRLIAGENIIMLPGTHVKEGSYLHAYIAPEGPFCGDLDKHFLATDEAAGVDNKTEEVTDINDIIAGKDTFFKVYPNPTQDQFTLELHQYPDATLVTVEIYGMRGELIKQRGLQADGQHRFSLEGHQPGIYLIRVTQGDKVGVERLIKR